MKVQPAGAALVPMFVMTNCRLMREPAWACVGAEMICTARSGAPYRFWVRPDGT